MEQFAEILDKNKGGRVVRWPFRILGAVLLAAALFVFFVSIFRGVTSGDPAGTLIATVTVPLVALLSRLVGYAVWKGRVLRNEFWPFASGAVAFVWVFVFLFVVLQYSEQAFSN